MNACTASNVGFARAWYGRAGGTAADHKINPLDRRSGLGEPQDVDSYTLHHDRRRRT